MKYLADLRRMRGNTGCWGVIGCLAVTIMLSSAAYAVPVTHTGWTITDGQSGGASSCGAFDPATSTCSNLASIPLRTSRGNPYLFEPYTDDETTTTGKASFSINGGKFWADLGVNNDD
jgi:hypothetical protein